MIVRSSPSTLDARRKVWANATGDAGAGAGWADEEELAHGTEGGATDGAQAAQRTKEARAARWMVMAGREPRTYYAGREKAARFSGRSSRGFPLAREGDSIALAAPREPVRASRAVLIAPVSFHHAPRARSPGPTMKIEQYTDDAVCFAMGLVQFAPNTPGDVLRLVCRPSFHPEICVTVTPAEFVAVALRSSLWQEPVPARMPEISERVPVAPGVFEALRAAFDEALAESRLPPRRVVLCDGMTASAMCTQGGRTDLYSGHAVNDAERRFVKDLLSVALSCVRSTPLRNRLSWCGWYVSSRDDPAFPVEPEPSAPATDVTRLLVLGTPDDRAAFHALHGAKVR